MQSDQIRAMMEEIEAREQNCVERDVEIERMKREAAHLKAQQRAAGEQMAEHVNEDDERMIGIDEWSKCDAGSKLRRRLFSCCWVV